MGFLRRRSENREQERREAWDVVMFQLVRDLVDAIPDEAEVGARGEIIWFNDDDSPMPGFFVLTAEEMVWAYADTMEVQRLDVSAGFRMSTADELSVFGGHFVFVHTSKESGAFLFPPDGKLLHAVREAGENLDD